MPLNRYKCNHEHEWTYLGPYKARECPDCGELTKPLLPSDIQAPSVMETVDKTRNVKWRDNFQEKAERRNKFYNSKQAKERARVHNDDPAKHGITEDDPKMV